jgi:alanyl-tRNA synthetase
MNQSLNTDLSPELSPEFLTQKTWDLYQTHGVPIEVSQDLLEQNNLHLDPNLLEKLIEEHQKLSQTTSKGQFKSGLGQDTTKTRKLHTTTHILHQVLRTIFGNKIKQMGSSITNEKARFDFSFDRKLEEKELTEISKKIQEIIDKNLEMKANETSPQEAQKLGAIGLFGEKYGESVTVYSLVGSDGVVYSREFCSGPHIKNSKEIGNFRILKQKSLGQDIKRLEFDVE